MPEQKMTYQERAICLCAGCKEYRQDNHIPEPSTEYQKRINTEFIYWCEVETENDLYIDDIWLISKRTVASQAEAIREALIEVLMKFCHYSEIKATEYADIHLLNHGYIEPKTTKYD